MSRWIYAVAFGALGLIVGAVIALSCYSAGLHSGARASGYIGEVTLSLVPGGMFLGGLAATVLGLSVARLADAPAGSRGLASDWLDVVLGALTSVAFLPCSVWAVAGVAGPILEVKLAVGAEQGYALSAGLGLGLVLLGALFLFLRLRRTSSAFANTLMASACIIAPILWGVVQVEAALPAM